MRFSIFSMTLLLNSKHFCWILNCLEDSLEGKNWPVVLWLLQFCTFSVHFLNSSYIEKEIIDFSEGFYLVTLKQVRSLRKGKPRFY